VIKCKEILQGNKGLVSLVKLKRSNLSWTKDRVYADVEKLNSIKRGFRAIEAFK
jgi:hypothetical protein